MESGRIQVDGEMVPVSYIVGSSQKISHFVHRFFELNDALFMHQYHK